jgi:two-component system sensor histidine kinase/response regulator
MRPGDFAAKFGCHRSTNVTEISVSNGSNAFLVTAPAPPRARRRALAAGITLLVVFCALTPFTRIPLPRIESVDPIFESTLALNNLE